MCFFSFVSFTHEAELHPSVHLISPTSTIPSDPLHPSGCRGRKPLRRFLISVSTSPLCSPAAGPFSTDATKATETLQLCSVTSLSRRGIVHRVGMRARRWRASVCVGGCMSIWNDLKLKKKMFFFVVVRRINWTFMWVVKYWNGIIRYAFKFSQKQK